MPSPKPLDACGFYTERTDRGMVIGRVREFPKLRSRAHTSPLDARDEIITLTRDKLAHLQAAADGLKAMP